MHMPISYFATRGFLALPYPENLRLAVKTTIEQWKQFCELPSVVKSGLSYSNNSDGVGYELKNGSGRNADRKENLDVTIAGVSWLKEHTKTIKNSTVSKLIENSVELVGFLKPLVSDFAKQLEESFGMRGILNEVKQSEDSFFVRFIHYFSERRVGEEIATPHVDQSGFTLHLFETSRGLQCLTREREWVNMPVSDGETVIIPAMQMQLRSKGEVKALCHRVVATTKTAQIGRYAAVCFVQLKKTPKYDKDTHGRLQEKPPGFNYDLPYDQLVNLFKR